MASNESDNATEGDIKVILVGDSAAGKTKLIQRYLLNDFKPQQISTYALTLFKYHHKPSKLDVDFWDSAGQHPSYYFNAHGCLLCFDVTRKTTYTNLDGWIAELDTFRPSCPVLVIANKCDLDKDAAHRDYAKISKWNQKRRARSDPEALIRFVSASDGTNVVAIFEEIIQHAIEFKKRSGDFVSEVMDLLRH